MCVGDLECMLVVLCTDLVDAKVDCDQQQRTPTRSTWCVTSNSLSHIRATALRSAQLRFRLSVIVGGAIL